MQKETEGAVVVTGYNGYGQLDTLNKCPRIINRFQDFPVNCQQGVIIVPLWSRTLVGQGNELKIFSGKSSGGRGIIFQEKIIDLCGNEDIALFLLANHELWKVELKQEETSATRLNFLLSKEEGESISSICCTFGGFYAISNKNAVYSIPTLIGQLPGGCGVTKLVAGFEHCVALLANGELFSWGGGLKGQLGLGELCDVEEPTLIEALSGIKIIDVAAGGWHSIAVSEFGDLYVWGWNKQGQLGVPLKLKRTIYPLPEIVDIITDSAADPEEIDSIACGSSHSIVSTKSGKLFGTGITKLGQLSGITSPIGFIDQFQEIHSPVPRIGKIICGFSSSFIFSNGTNENVNWHK